MPSKSKTQVQQAETNAVAAQPIAGRGLNSSWISIDNLEQLQLDIQVVLNIMKHDMQIDALSPAERRRLLGLGVRRYGFTDKVKDFAVTNPEFAPAFFNSGVLDTRIREAEILRDISADLQQMLRINEDVLLEVSDDAFNMALSYYNTVREASRRRRPGAQAIFNALKSFFSRPRRSSEEPTEHEVERDVRALLHGTKEGEIVIKNEGKKVSKGEKIVVDETHKSKGEWKETESGEID